MSTLGSLRQGYETNGHALATNVLRHTDLDILQKELEVLVDSLNRNTAPMEERSSYKKAFIQITNLWQRSEIVKTFVFRKDLAKLAADIMGVSGVRLYHDQALFKEAGGGPTPWHVDQVYWPMDTPNTCTLWIPLQDTSLEMGPLAFASGSHVREDGRNLVISDESQEYFEQWVSKQDLSIHEEAVKKGDLTLHAGWTVHKAGPNHTKLRREVMTIIYMADDACLLDPLSATQKVDRHVFTPGIAPGAPIDSGLNPLLYSAEVVDEF